MSHRVFFQLEGFADASWRALVDHAVPPVSFCALVERALSMFENTGAVYVLAKGVYFNTYCCKGSELSICAGVEVALAVGSAMVPPLLAVEGEAGVGLGFI